MNYVIYEWSVKVTVWVALADVIVFWTFGKTRRYSLGFLTHPCPELELGKSWIVEEALANAPSSSVST